jgi:hypothetical protein
MKRKRTLKIGGRYKYFIPPTEYIVDEVIMDATDEEKTGKLSRTVIYTQKISGIYPVGTRYARKVDDFLGQIEHNRTLVNKFELMENF